MAQDNLIAISKIAERLGNLADRVVFIRGATPELLAPDPGGAPPRITKDVDVVIEVSSSLDDLSRLAADLRQRGFRQLSGAPIFRWTLDETTVDFLPTRTEILGFSDRWYPKAFTHAVDHFLPDEIAPIPWTPGLCRQRTIAQVGFDLVRGPVAVV